MTKYFNQSDFSSMPVKTTINNDLYSTMFPKMSNNKLFKITRNRLIRQDSYLTNLDYYEELEFYQYTFLNSYTAMTDLS